MHKIRTGLVIRMLRTESPASVKCCHQMVTPRTIALLWLQACASLWPFKH